MSRILIILFAILLLLVAGEVGYYFFYQQATPKPVVTTLPPPEVNPTPNPNQALNDLVLKNLRLYKKSLVTSTILNVESTGKIVFIDSNGGVDPTTNFHFKLRIQLLDGQNNTTNFVYSESDLMLAKFFTKTTNGQQPINLSDLKNGDTIVIKESYDLQKDINSNLIGLEIVKQ